MTIYAQGSTFPLGVAERMSRDTKPTLHDVGALAGVTARTVSRVVNGEPSVSKSTKEKVRKAIETLHFHPNLAAKALRSERSFLVAILNNNPSPHYVADVVRGVSQVCRQTGTFLTLEEFLPDDVNIARSIAALLDRIGLAGAILIPPMTDDLAVLDLLEARGVPIIRMSPAHDVARTPAVFARDGDGVRALVEHLHELGHRQFAIIGGPSSHSSSLVRMAAFKRALSDHGIPLASIIIEQGDYTYDSGAKATRRILERSGDTRPSVICAANDEMAAGVIGVLGASGIAVPAEVAVTGFDDSEIARMIWPTLTTVRQSIVEQAVSAAHLLLDRNRLPDEPRRIDQNIELVIRKSTLRDNRSSR
ncbi:LacI family DNA-binding transcriptional regulator [Sphingobium sp. CR2-8]|uniref:LacI family DNA-binding transcriptional regulator n=1 Tax=Sphingobium sp. CR2-8 TaxID=1306534 RepID=UPI002DBF067B|nr:LacI family DNA-binding transcriptional regulator [Sphingobium sp. CR2-8]MEC3909483.1 LacI family DNA-binding transcriptional regulator [Sphingobium sp. CR2-8]